MRFLRWFRWSPGLPAYSAIDIYTDGGERNGYGGFGSIILLKDAIGGIIHEQVLFGSALGVTRMHMEIAAAIVALEAVPERKPITVLTDSQRLVDVATTFIYRWEANGWMNSKDVPPADLEYWQRLHLICQRRQPVWKLVKGHAGNPFNEQMHQLATNARHELEKGCCACEWCRRGIAGVNLPCINCYALGIRPKSNVRRVMFLPEPVS